MAATTGADAISAAASRSASFCMITTKRFSTNLAKIQRAHSFLVPYALRAYPKVYWLCYISDEQFERLLGLVAMAERLGIPKATSRPAEPATTRSQDQRYSRHVIPNLISLCGISPKLITHAGIRIRADVLATIVVHAVRVR